MKRRVVVFVSVAILTAFAIFVLGSHILSLQPAHAQGRRPAPQRLAPLGPPQIPSGQAVCTFTADTFVPPGPPGSPASAPVNITLGADANVKVEFSSESVVGTAGDILGVSYAVDGGPPTIFGPEFFASNTNTFESHTAINIVPLAAGAHTIQPFAYIYGTGTGVLWFRCLTVEGNTN